MDRRAKYIAREITRLAALARPPLQKFLEQPLALLGQRGGFLAAANQELLELVPLRLWRGVPAQPFVCAFEPLPARQHRCEVRLPPFRTARGLLEFGELREKFVDELLDAPIAIGALLPVGCDQHCP